MKVRRQYHSNVDIVVLLDTTGSMGWCRDEIVDHICGFADDLSRLQHDLRIALYAFRDLRWLESPTHYPFTADIKEFQTLVRKQEAYGGGGNNGESSLDAAFDAMEVYQFRPDAGRYFLLFTDEPPHSPDQNGRTVCDLAAALRRDRIVTYVVSDPLPPFVEIADSYGGLHFDIRASRGAFRPLFFNLSRSITEMSMGRPPLGAGSEG